MKELIELEQWASKIIANEAVQDRPLSRSQDIQYQASREFPDRSPEQALQLYVSNKIADNEKMDFEQNKLINAQKRENEKLRRNLSDLANELSNHERTAMDTEREVQRLRDLSAKLKPAGELQQNLIKVSQEQVQKMLSDLDALRTKPGMDPEKFNELKTQIEKAKDGKSSGKEVKELQKMLNTLNQKQEVDDELFATLSSKLQSIEQMGREKIGSLETDLQKKEDRFRKSLAKNAQKIQQWGNKYAEIDQKINQAEDNAKTLLTNIEEISDDASEKINRLTQLLAKIDPSFRQQAMGATLPAATTAMDKGDQEEVHSAMAKNQPVSGEELTGQEENPEPDDRQYGLDDISDLVNKYGRPQRNVKGAVSMNEELRNDSPDELESKLIPTMVRIYNNLYPTDLRNWHPEQLKEIIRRTIDGSLLIYAPDVDEARIRKYLEYCRRWLRKTKPATPELDLDEPSQAIEPMPAPKPGQANWPPGPGPDFFKESLVRQYEDELNKLTGGF